MFQRLQQKWRVGPTQLLLILLVFAITGTATAWLTKAIISLVGFDETTHWSWKVLLRLGILVFGYQAILLTVAFLLGQFPFFWKYERKILSRLGFRNLRVARYEHPENNANLMNTNDLDKGKELIESKVTQNTKHKTQNRIAIFASGAGTNAEKIIQYFGNHAFIKVVLVVCNKPGAGVLRIAANNKIATLLIEKERFFREDGYVEVLKEAGIDFIVLAGFLWKIPQSLINAYPRRIINIHPALLPKYGGKGMYGQYVHESVLQAGEMESGITIHYVDEQYDNGDIIFQTACPVIEGDSPQTLAQRIHTLEHLHYPIVIEEVVKNG